VIPSANKRIVSQFYTLDDVAKSELDADLVSLLKDAEMYTNIYAKRSLGTQDVDLIKHWICHFSEKNYDTDEKKQQRNDTAQKLLD
jgi:hypothetical protein